MITQSTEPATKPIQEEQLNEWLVSTNGNLKGLVMAEIVFLYKRECKTMGIDPSMRPLLLMDSGGRVEFFADKRAASILAEKHDVSTKHLQIIETDKMYEVIIQATRKDGRTSEDIGACTLEGLTGKDRADAKLSAWTKAKRRAILGVCGCAASDILDAPVGARVVDIDSTPNQLNPAFNPEKEDKTLEIAAEDREVTFIPTGSWRDFTVLTGKIANRGKRLGELPECELELLGKNFNPRELTPANMALRTALNEMLQEKDAEKFKENAA